MDIFCKSLCIFVKFICKNSDLMFNFIKKYEYKSELKKVINAIEKR